MSDEFQVQTIGVGVEVVLANSTVLKGSVFLHQTAQTHLGEEKIEDLLNAQNQFFPLALRGAEGTVLVNKKQILLLKVPHVPGKEPRPQDVGFSWAVKVSIELVQGATQTGVLYFTQPPGRDRTLDGLNQGHDFLCLVQENAFCYVQRGAAVCVKELGPQFESIAPPAP